MEREDRKQAGVKGRGKEEERCEERDGTGRRGQHLEEERKGEESGRVGIVLVKLVKVKEGKSGWSVLKEGRTKKVGDIADGLA